MEINFKDNNAFGKVECDDLKLYIEYCKTSNNIYYLSIWEDGRYLGRNFCKDYQGLERRVGQIIQILNYGYNIGHLV